jgi:SET domain-containing protein
MPYSPRKSRYKLNVRRGLSGLGMFAEQDIPKGKFLIEYWGKLMPDDDAQYIGGRYLCELGNGKTIAGNTKRNLARLINHSCKPNAEVMIKGNKVFIYSRKKIKLGDEITYDYGEEYFDYYIKPHGCRCSGCRPTKKLRESKK